MNKSINFQKGKFTFSGRGVIKSTFITSFFSLFGLIVTFAIQMVLAAKFGARMEMDAYLAATTVPMLLTTVLLTSLNVTFIPVFIEYETKENKEEAWKIANSFINMALIGLAMFAAIGIICAPQLIALTVPGFVGEKYLLAVKLNRICFPVMVFSGLAGFLSSIHYSQHRFAIPALGPALNGIIVLGIVLTLADRLGIASIAIGSLLGGGAQCFLLIPIMFREQRYHCCLNYQHPVVKKVIVLMTPLLLGQIFGQSGALIDRFVASKLAEGSISYLGYARKLMSIIITLTGGSISIVMLPLLSRYANDRNKMGDAFSLILRMSMVAIVPILTIILILRTPIIELLFQRGLFDAHATAATATALLYYSGALYITAGCGGIFSTILYSLQQTKVAALIWSLGAIVNAILAIMLAKYIGFRGPAVAYSIYSISNVVLILIFLAKKFKIRLGVDVLYCFLRISLSCTVSGILGWIAYPILRSTFSSSPSILAEISALSLAAGLFILIYVILMSVLRANELRILYRMIIQRKL